MKSKEEIERRIDEWERAFEEYKNYHYLEIYRETIMPQLQWVLDNYESFREIDERILNRRNDERAKKMASDFVDAELTWIMDIEGEVAGGLRKAIWEMLALELHDLPCTMRYDGTDLILEFNGFWLKLKNGEYEERPGSQAGDKIYILWSGRVSREPEERFVITGERNGDSEVVFSGDDFEYGFKDGSKLEDAE
jgi:hypothetical protein